MNTFLRLGSDRIHKRDTWKESWYAFVPYSTHFGELCGFADDIVNAGQGFGMHPHKNMEITTILRHGAQAHKDDTGSEGIVTPNCIQTMSAGTGIMHSEFNASQTESFHSYQIWVYPKESNAAPRHEQFTFVPSDKLNQVLLAISPDGKNGSAKINQDAFFSVAHLEADRAIEYSLNLENNGVYIHCAQGSVKIADHILNTGDAIGVYATQSVKVHANSEAELVMVEVPMGRGIRL